MSKQLKIYIGCSLTHAPAEFRSAVEGLKQSLRPRYHIYDFLGLKKGTIEQVYQWDIKKCVAGCDLFVAICDYASLGLGYELGAAVEAYGKLVLAVAHKNANISRLIQGIDSPHFNFERYTHLSEVSKYIESKLKIADLA